MSAARQRDPLLDLWRGLALIDMAWVHLALYPIGMPDSLASWIGELTRFAAGSFVLISGMTVARVFGPKLAGSAAEARAARHRLFRRALMLLFLDRTAAVTYALIAGFEWVPPGVTPVHESIARTAFFGEPGVTGGLLFLYAVLLVATPLLDAARRRFGGPAVLAASVALYGIGYACSPSPHPDMWPFPTVLWQLFFVLGYVVSDGLDRVRNASGHVAAWWRCLVSCAFGAVFLARNGEALGLALPSMLASSHFVKVPLSPAELTWYVLASAFVLTWSAWTWECAARARSALAWVCRLGRKSLLVYVTHLFLQLPVVDLLTALDPSPPWRATMLPLTAAALLSIAVAGERLDPVLARREPRTRVPGLFGLPSSGVVGSAVACAAVVAVITLQVFIRPPLAWNAGPGDDGGGNAPILATSARQVEEIPESADPLDLPGYCADLNASGAPPEWRAEPALRLLVLPERRENFSRRWRRNLRPWRFIGRLKRAFRGRI